MKPLQLLIAAAVIAIGALVWLMAGPEHGRAGGRTPREGEPGEAHRLPEPARAATGGAVTVAVVMPDGSAAAGAAVELTGRLERSVQAGADGGARIEALPPGAYELLARKERFAGALSFELDGDRDLGTLRLGAAVSVKGRVLSAEGDPLAGATVEASRAPPPDRAAMDLWRRALEPDAVVARAAAAASGAYELLLPGPGRYRLRASATGFAPALEEDRPFDVDARDIDFHLEPGSLVEGRVVDAAGRPVAGARIVAAAGATRVFGREAGVKSAATSGDDGRFAVAVGAGGDVTLRVTAAGFAPHTEPQVRPPVRDLLVTLESGLSLRLRAIDDATGRPLEGIAVTAYLADASRDGTTDAQGEVRFDRLSREGGRPSRSQVVLAGGGYVPKMEDVSRIEPVDGLLDVGDVALQRGGVVRGRVLEAGTSAPVAGARVSWFARSAIATMADATDALSRADGSYELSGVPLDATAILAARPGYVPETDVRELMRRQERVFPEGLALVERDVLLAPARAVRGVVLAPDGSPAAGARVASVGPAMPFLGGAQVSDAISGEDGTFEMSGFPDGATVFVLAEHRAFATSARVRATAGGDPVTLRLLEPQAIRGKVVDEEGQAVGGVRVAAGPRGARPRFGPREDTSARSTVTDAAGRFLVRNASEGELDVTFDHPEYEVRRVPVTARGGTHDMGEIALERGPGIEGTVVDADGAPLAGVRVIAAWQREPGAPAVADAADGRSWAQARTEAGRFAFHGLREGRYRIQPQHEGWFGERPVVPAGTRDVRIVMKPAAEMRGRVLGDGGPLAGAFVRAMLGGGDAGAFLGGTRTGDDGGFVLGGLPPDEPFDLAITHQDYREKRLPGVRAGGAPRDFALDAGAGFAGAVVEPDGTPVPNATIQVSQGGRRTKTARADGEGRFEVGGLEAGPLEVAVTWTPGGHVKGAPVAVRPGDRDVRLVVERGERISGRIAWKREESATPVRIEAIAPGGEAIAQAWAWPQNPAFELAGLPKGTYAVRVSRNVVGEGIDVVAELQEVATGARDLRIEVPE